MAEKQRKVAVRDGGRRQFLVERYDAPGDSGAHRYLFIGPLPGRVLFTSSAGPLAHAVADARKQWAEMDPQRRDKWFGPKGIYTLAGAKQENAE